MVPKIIYNLLSRNNPKTAVAAFGNFIWKKKKSLVSLLQERSVDGQDSILKDEDGVAKMGKKIK